MLFKFRCQQTVPDKNGVDASFDIPGSGARPLVLRLPLPGPKVGEFYEVTITGPGIAVQPTAAAPAEPSKAPEPPAPEPPAPEPAKPAA